MAIKRTCNVKGDSNPYQALASAIVVLAIKDYRNRGRMLRRIKRRLKNDELLSNEERECLRDRCQKYEEQLDDAGDFFFSQWFAQLCDLDGYDILDNLNREVFG